MSRVQPQGVYVTVVVVMVVTSLSCNEKRGRPK